MHYTNFRGEDISQFAMGCMRLPVIDGNDSAIDQQAAAEMVAAAMAAGCNYYDTAWGYHGGNSEPVMGKILSAYPRDSYNLASKFPGYDPKNWDKVAEIFATQLTRCGVEYFDYYLVHNVCEQNIDAYLDDETYGIVPYLLAQKEAGRIRHLGFSAHATVETLERFLAKYGSDMEFAQLQLNYIDYEFQNDQAKMDLCTRYGLPIWVMEPMRGGSLAKATPEEEALLKACRPDESVAAWALRFLQSIPEVATVLCGSSSLEQLQENLAILSDPKPLSNAEREVLDGIVRQRMAGKIAPCTACKYCLDHCPLGINIPFMMELYNEHKFTGGGFIAPMAIDATPKGQRPGDCIGCGACATVCPQSIDIPGTLAEFAALLEK